MSPTLVANKWYPQYKGHGRSYKSLYPTPQSILRKSVGVEDYKFICKTATPDHIRAACIMPRGVPYRHLTNAPWSLVYTTPEWVMIIVSVADRYQWIDLCKASGALAWQCSHNMTVIYEWQPAPLDDNGLEIRPPNALGGPKSAEVITEDGTIKRRKDYNQPKKDYDRQALIDDLRANLMTYDQMSDKYGLTRQTIYNIRWRAGIGDSVVRKDKGTAKKPYDREALVKDIKENKMTYVELGQKYNLKAISVQRIARVEGLTKPRVSKRIT